MGDTQFLSGEVVDKREEDGRCLVDLKLAMVNQRDIETAYGTATGVVAVARRSGLPPMPPVPVDLERQAAGMFARHNELTAQRGASRCPDAQWRDDALPVRRPLHHRRRHPPHRAPRPLDAPGPRKGYEDRVPQVHEVDGVPTWTMDGNALARAGASGVVRRRRREGARHRRSSSGTSRTCTRPRTTSTPASR